MYFYNTLTRQKKEFKPLKKGHVGLYTCGPTVYNYAHIGNLRTFLFEDFLRRALEFSGYTVNHVMNITDVGHLTSDADEGEDKMAKGAKREHKTVWEIAKFYTDAFLNDVKELNILPAHHYPRATDHIQEMIALIQRLEKNGYTYISGGNVYFNTKKLKDYGKLAQLEKQELQAGARIEVDKNKKNPHDFVLWFTESKHGNQDMQWDPSEWGSNWGRGFPGWHIECSAMSMKYLGDHFDIHCGGIDHIAVHHTNEIAQSEGALGSEWVHTWMHGNFLVIQKTESEFKLEIDNKKIKCPHCGFEFIWEIKNIYTEGPKEKNEKRTTISTIKCGQCNKMWNEKNEGTVSKMAKSGDNFLTLKLLKEKGFDALDYRYFCLQAHYSKELVFSWDALEAAKTGLKKLKEKIKNKFPPNIGGIQGGRNKQKNIKQKEKNKYLSSFAEALQDDLNMPQALATLWELLGDDAVSDAEKRAIALEMDKVFGLKLEELKSFEIPSEIEALINERNEARHIKDWEMADNIRAQIEAAGYIVKDEGGKTVVEPK